MIPLLAWVAFASTRYSIVGDHGVSWLQGADGKRFFSLGVCCVDTGTAYAEYRVGNPSYAAYRYYPELKDWANDTCERLGGWGFNTIGAWSDAKMLGAVKSDLRFTPILHIGSSAGAPWRDMWDPDIVKTMDQVARDQIEQLKKNPRVIGYFSDNEMGWWNGALFDWAWKGKHTRAVLVELLRKRYRDRWPSLQQDFEADKAAGFSDLAQHGRLYLRPGARGMQLVQSYIEVLAGRYYGLCRQIIKRYDPRALYLGDRYISNFYPAVAKAAGGYSDVVSTNLNADWNDGTFAPFYLPALHRISGKPLMITEYYMCAKENRTGNKNDSSGFPTVETQPERAKGFERSTKILLGTPFVLGAHWFQYYDEPRNGRPDGENYDMGLVDVENRPYEEITSTARGLDLDGLHAAPLPAPSANASVPKLRASQLKSLAEWPRERAWLKPFGIDDRGDAYLGWTADALYLALYWNEDRFPEAFYRTGKIPVVDEPVAVIGSKGLICRLRLGASGQPVLGPATVVSLANGVRNTAVIRVPASAFGLSRFEQAQQVKFEVVLDTRSRAYQVSWKVASVLGE